MLSLSMTIPFQTNNTLRCSVSTTTTKSQPKLVVNDPSLKSTWTHRLWVTASCTTLFASLAKSVAGGFDSHLWLEPALSGFVGYILADLGSGVYHWVTDNYGDESTFLVGTHVKDSQEHHKSPWRIAKRGFANNLHSLAKGTTFMVLPLVIVFDDPVVHGFVSMFGFCVVFCQQFHAWAHGTKSKLPPLVVAFQDLGLLVSRREHANHHRGMYNRDYCVVSGVWNKVLDESNVFEALEMVLYIKLGVRPRSWTDPNSEWIKETDISNNKQA